MKRDHFHTFYADKEFAPASLLYHKKEADATLSVMGV